MSRAWAAVGAASGTGVGFVVGSGLGAHFRRPDSDQTEVEAMNSGAVFGVVIGAAVGAAIGAGSSKQKQIAASGVGALPSNMGDGFFP